MPLFASTIYKTYGSVALQPQELQTDRCLIDMGAGSNVVYKSFLHLTWAPRVKRQYFLKLECAEKQPTKSERLYFTSCNRRSTHMRLIWSYRSSRSWPPLGHVVHRQICLKDISRKARTRVMAPTACWDTKFVIKNAWRPVVSWNEYDRAPGYEPYHNVIVFKPATLAPCSHTNYGDKHLLTSSHYLAKALSSLRYISSSRNSTCRRDFS